MIKKLLALSLFSISSLFSYAQDLRIIYNVNSCAGNPLVGQPSIYIYPSVGVSSPSAYDEYFGGSTSGTMLPLNNSGNGLWEICLNPYTFTDALGTPVPASATIFNIRMYFRNQSGSIFTGNCSGNYLQITNPMTTSPISSDPSIVNSLRNCFVSVNSIDNLAPSVYLSPNPAKANSVFYLNLPRGGNVEIEIFNMLGKKIKSVVAKNQTAGEHKINFNLEDSNGNPLSNGYYFYTFKLNGQSIKTGKIIATN